MVRCEWITTWKELAPERIAVGVSHNDQKDQLRARLGHDGEAERTVVRDELRKITRLRMTKTLNL